MIIPSILSLIAGYLIGSNMTAVGIARRKCVDIRDCGSGNAGSTNVLRTFGWKWGLICLTCDSAKGAISVGIGRLIGYLWGIIGLGMVGEAAYSFFSYCGLLGAIIGHLLPIFHNFRGGKCVAVALGGLLVIAPIQLLIALGVALLLILITKMVSVGSVVGTLLVAVLVIIKNWGDYALMVLLTIIAAVVVIAHLPNIQRVMEGRERRLGNIEWEKDDIPISSKPAAENATPSPDPAKDNIMLSSDKATGASDTPAAAGGSERNLK